MDSKNVKINVDITDQDAIKDAFQKLADLVSRAHTDIAILSNYIICKNALSDRLAKEFIPLSAAESHVQTLELLGNAYASIGKEAVGCRASELLAPEVAAQAARPDLTLVVSNARNDEL
ncbi:MAG: hypothetical protein ABIR16_03430 [Dokdonella sp.]